MKTQTIYITVSFQGESTNRFKQRELAEAQALLWNNQFPGIAERTPWVVIAVELPIHEPALQAVA